MVSFDQAAFEGLYYNDPYRPAGAAHYRDGEWVDARVQRLAAKGFAGKILVAGCAHGFLVAKLRALGLDAWGIDASTWAVSQDASGGFVKLGNVLVSADVAGVKAAAGLKGGQKFTVCVTEDLLPCLTDSEVATALTELRAVSTSLYHLVTDAHLAAERDPAFNWKKLPAWKTAVGTELVYGFESEAEL